MNMPRLVMLLAASAIPFTSCSKPEADNAPPQKVSLTVKGMTCQGCANTITAALKMQPGVKKAVVVFDTSTATVEFSEGKVTPAQLAEAVKKAGYTAEVKME
jgi:copper chaperone CopZ